MSKRKTFTKTDISIPRVEHDRDVHGIVSIPFDALPPSCTTVEFEPNFTKTRRFDFAPWYGGEIDPIVYACQRQIERFLDKQDADVEVVTIIRYCVALKTLFRYLITLRMAKGRPLDLADVNRAMIDGYLRYLRDQGNSADSQRVVFSYNKSVLRALGRRGIILLIDRGADATFPSNPFAGSTRAGKGEQPMSIGEKNAFTLAVRDAVRPLIESDMEPSSALVGYALLVVALHTGRNTNPLLEMSIDCLRTHPKEGYEFLVVHKRRGHTTSKVTLRADATTERIVETTPSLRAGVSHLVRRVIHLTNSLRLEAPSELNDRVWLYRKTRDGNGGIGILSVGSLEAAVNKLVNDYGLRGDDGRPMRINISRLRKTFVNRVYEILDGDVAATATAAGNSLLTTMRAYLRPSEESSRNWRFMGMVLVDELLSNTLGSTERTPVGRCSDALQGEYAPKRDGDLCQSFLNCLRCRNYVVTGDDLWRLFSFYWRVLGEQPRVDKRRWSRQLSHIPRLIERDVIEVGIRKKLFKLSEVDAARNKARHTPHPFWATPLIISDLESLN